MKEFDLRPTRRRLLSCMAMAGAATVWGVRGGVPEMIAEAEAATEALTFAQISDTHIGFAKEPNTDPGATLTEALGRLKTLPQYPKFLLHTGDVTHFSKAAEFDTAHGLIQGAGLETFFVPGEHDVIDDDGAGFFARFGRSKDGWYSFDVGGVHFVGLVNVRNLKPGGLGALGPDQLAWLKDDLHAKSASTPLVVFAHMPLWGVYPQWGWGTDDAAPLFDLVKRFGSVTVLNGHIHQVLQKVEGHVSFATARSTAFPQATPGEGPGPGPLKVPSDKLKAMLGVRAVAVGRKKASVIDQALEA